MGPLVDVAIIDAIRPLSRHCDPQAYSPAPFPIIGLVGGGQMAFVSFQAAPGGVELTRIEFQRMRETQDGIRAAPHLSSSQGSRTSGVPKDEDLDQCRCTVLCITCWNCAAVMPAMVMLS